MLTSPIGARADSTASYAAGGTAVVKTTAEGTILDAGGVVCASDAGQGLGGACLPWNGPTNAVKVTDTASGMDVAFQVCIDNDGDSACTSGGPQRECSDQVFFSHGKGGAFFNPMEGLPKGFKPGCGGTGAFAGYVVFLCQGAHEENRDPHVHPAAGGTMQSYGVPLLPPRDVFGDFCGGGGSAGAPGPAVTKPYLIA